MSDSNPYLAPQESSLETSGATAARYVVLLFFCLAALLAYVPRSCLGVVEKDIREELALSERQSGWLMAAFFWTYAAAMLPAGAWAGRWGTRRALTCMAAVWSGATLLASLPLGFAGLMASRLGMGAAQSGMFAATTNSTSRWFPPLQLGLAGGLLAGCMSVGGALSMVLSAKLFEAVGWRWMFFMYALPGLAWAAVFYAWFRDRPEDHPAVNEAELAKMREGRVSTASEQHAAVTSSPAALERTPWLALVRSAAMWGICGQQFFRAAGYIFYVSWFATYLREGRGQSIGEAGWLTSLPLLAVVIGSPCGGLVTDWLLRRTGSRRASRQMLAAGSLATCGVLILLATQVQNVVLAVLVLSAGSFCSALAGPAAYAITIDMGGRHVPMVFSTMNMAGNIGAALFPAVVPEIKALGDWSLVFFSFAGIYFAAAACWLVFSPQGSVYKHASV